MSLNDSAGTDSAGPLAGVDSGVPAFDAFGSDLSGLDVTGLDGIGLDIIRIGHGRLQRLPT